MSAKVGDFALSLRKKSEVDRPHDFDKSVLRPKGEALCACSCMVGEHLILKASKNRSPSWKSMCTIESLVEDEKPSMNESCATDNTDMIRRIELKLLKKAQERVPPERANVQLDVEKLRKLFAETIDYLRFTMRIPLLVENNFSRLKKLLPDYNVEQIKKLLEPIDFTSCSLFKAGEYEFRRRNFFTESSASSIEKFYAQYREKELALNGQEIENVWAASTGLYNIYKSKPKLFESELDIELPDHVRELIDSLEKLFNHVLGEMKRSPTEAERDEIELSRMYLAFESLGTEMVHLHRNLRPSIEANLYRIMDVCKEVSTLKEQRRKLKEFLENSHHRIKSNLEKKSMMYNLDAMKTTKEKMGPRRELITRHQILVKEDLAEEKELRVKKYKIEQVLQSVMNKYEEDMANRNQKLAHLNEMYEMETAQMKKMQERFDAQEKIYDLLMDEKEKYEQAEMEGKLKDIRRRIAARRIQRFYRGYLAFMQAHGRKKGKGKSRGKKRA